MDFGSLIILATEVIISCGIGLIIILWMFCRTNTPRDDSSNVGEEVQSKATQDDSHLQHSFGEKAGLTDGNGREKATQSIKNESTVDPPQMVSAATDEHGTDIDKAMKRSVTFSTLLSKIGLNGKDKEKLTIFDGMRVSSIHVSGQQSDSVIENFIAKLASYDYRVQQININMNEQILDEANETSEASEAIEGNDCDDWTVSPSDEGYVGANEASYCARDILYVILNCLDPFFLQEVLMKLSACQIAVPVLLPDITCNNVTFLVWGLRKIVKSWCDDKNSSSIKEDTIVCQEMLTVAAVRIGQIPMSKSNVLNKLLGPTQGNDDHPFFMSFEQDSSPAVLSEGIVECVWFLPGTEIGHISSPFALLNLRGDYLQHTKQAEFAIDMAFLTIVFIDSKSIQSHKNLVENIRLKSHVIVVCCQNILQKKSKKTASRTFENANYQLTQIFSAGLSTLEISAEISKVIKDLVEKKNGLKVTSLQTAVGLAQKLNLVIDEKHEDCIEAKQLALEIFNEIKTFSPDKYKLEHFKLQKHWKKWSENSKNERWNTFSENLENEKAKHDKKQQSIRLAQANERLSPHLQKICTFLLQSKTIKRDYFLSWLLIHLNDISTEFVKPLTKQLMEKSSQKRHLSNEISKMEKTLQNVSNVKTDSKNITHVKKQEEDKIGEHEKKLIKQFDEKSLGVEHYMREFGQLVESYYYTKLQKPSNAVSQKPSNAVYIEKLPRLAAKMLLNGQPLEILDGDVSDVPTMWLTEVLKAAVEIIEKDATVYVISVLGIQSSGKSTLLNSMFGVRFAASAGRCTRGVFMQLLPIKDEVRNHLNCDYLIIVDTEGLRAPEKSISSYIHEDNELATFALCISNLTLINIGGQTMGEDMTNVLQIAAHAFVRMTQVDLKPECRIIQQFVADVTADQKNETAMQTILMKLDEAAREAAKKEGKEHLYRQFSDVFVVQNYSSDATNVQYIPSLWRGFMGAPDYQYSLRVQQLKSTILQSIEQKKEISPLTLTDFYQRISDVWDAIKKEDFVFSFQNTKEVTLYQEVTYFYKDLIQPIRQELIEIELSARISIENAAAQKIDDIIETNLSQIRDILQDRCQVVREKLKEKCNQKKYDLVRKYSTYFETDLQALQEKIERSIRSTFDRHATITKAAHKKDSVLQSLSVEIHDKFAEFAHTLRKQTDQRLGGGNADDVNSIIDTKFKTEWTGLMKDVKARFPLRSLSKITEEIKTNILRNLKDFVQFSDLSKETVKLLTGDMYSYTSQDKEISSEHIEKLKLLFCSINEKSEKPFEELFLEIRDIAEKVQEFEINVPIVLEKIKAFMNTNKFVINKNFILLYMLSQFLILAHRAQQRGESEIVSKSPSAMSEVCTEMNILEESQIKPVLIGFIMEALPDHKRTDTLKAELEECTDDIFISDEKTGKKTRWGKFLETVLWSDDSSKVLLELGNKIKNDLAKLLERNDGKCSKEVVGEFAALLVHHCSVQKVHNNKDKHAPLKHFFKLGEITFTEAFHRCIHNHMYSKNYKIKFAEPRTLTTLQMKLEYLFTGMKRTFSEELLQFLKRELITLNVVKLDTIPHVYSLLQRIDFRFLKILPNMETKDIEFVTTIIDKAKSLILTTAQPNTTFYEYSFVRHVQEIFQTTNTILEKNKVRAAAIVHVGAWALPVYARRQFDFEKENNIAFLIQNDVKMFETEFKSLASNCQDEMVAERFVEIIELNLTEGFMNILYPMIYASMLSDHSEFRMKKNFIGSVLKSLFETKNISGIAQFLSSFTHFSHSWILSLVAKKIKNNPLWLENLITQCIKSLVTSTTLTLLEVTDQFKDASGDSFSRILDAFVLKYKTNTKLTCKNADIEKLKRHLNVNDSNRFLLKCEELFNNLNDILRMHFPLPPVNDEEEIKSWLTKSLPKTIHIDLFDTFKGCEEQCPFCKTVCDENLSDHPKHESLFHLPCGLTGFHYFHSDVLSTFICNSVVESELKYKMSQCEPNWRLFKEYEDEFPNWKIRPNKSSQPRLFWKHLFAKYNEKFAEIHKRIKADIPDEWNNIEEKDALENLSEIYNLNE